MKDDKPTIIGKAFAGHALRADSIALRAAGNDEKADYFEKKAVQYDNPLTDWVNLIIAERKAKVIHKETEENASENSLL